MMFATTFLMALHLGLKNTHWKRLFPLSVALFAYLVPASIAFLIHYQPWLVYYFMYYLVWGFLFYFLIHLFFGALGLGFGSFIRKKRAHKEANQ
ncbi:MAG: hypothetical protein FWE12_01180 [Oscillospiraceae bacterium]|nr:hypothetical protein [Oscillospiraceae bacterium]